MSKFVNLKKRIVNESAIKSSINKDVSIEKTDLEFSITVRYTANGKKKKLTRRVSWEYLDLASVKCNIDTPISEVIREINDITSN